MALATGADGGLTMDEYIKREAEIAAAFSATSLGNTAFRDVYDTVNRFAESVSIKNSIGLLMQRRVNETG